MVWDFILFIIFTMIVFIVSNDCKDQGKHMIMPITSDFFWSEVIQKWWFWYPLYIKEAYTITKNRLLGRGKFDDLQNQTKLTGMASAGFAFI